MTEHVRVLDDVVDELGDGLAQLQVLILGGGTGFVAGSLKVLLGIVAPLLGRTWHLSGIQRASLVSAVFAGQGIGNCVFGFLCDQVGRRPVLICFYAFSGLFAVCSTVLATDFWSMLAWRAALGLSFGLCTTPWNALAAEVCRSSVRVQFNALGGAMFTLGILFSLVNVYSMDPNMEQLDWRRLTIWAVIPGAFLIGPAYKWLLESPRFLDQSKQRAEAVMVLRRMGELNHCPEVDVTNWSVSDMPNAGIMTIFGRPLRYTTLTICCSTFVLNFAYYGSYYVYPQLLPDRKLFFPPAGNMILNVCIETVGYAIAVTLEKSQCISRRQGLLFYLVFLSLFSFLFVIAIGLAPRSDEVLQSHHALPMALLSLAMYGNAITISVGWIFVYVYAAEVYPTACRASGSGIGIAFGRLGSILCPLVFEALSSEGYQYQIYFVIIVVVAVLNALCVSGLPVETKDRQLGAIAEESQMTLRK